MENIELILSIAATAVGLLITTITFISKFVKNAKSKKLMEDIVKIGNEIIPYIEEAESIAGKSGNEKKDYVLEQLKKFALKNDVEYDSAKISEKIEELIKLTKQVNKREEKLE